MAFKDKSRRNLKNFKRSSSFSNAINGIHKINSCDQSLALSGFKEL
jgi:hypothetical protein